ncbi:MarR family winged helix-turn-helix transcriptional regulator [Ectobacillus funiculus]|uniref:MarR family winged helix-turn-helix transcriptional regulator n=1 Tax=Ectobacillus funiculus TaxID=137993 RepID=UPI00101B7A3B|nr:MarR family transcriptional regulator [Ectobacillus funiculus]
MNLTDNLKLENQLCFALYACSREITRLYRPVLDQFGITFPQYLTLLVLWEHNRLTVKEIGDLLYLDSGTLTPMLKRMETMDLVKRVRAMDDERKVWIEITEKANELKNEAVCIPQMCSPHFGITHEEYVDLMAQLKQILGNLQKETRNIK